MEDIEKRAIIQKLISIPNVYHLFKIHKKVNIKWNKSSDKRHELAWHYNKCETNKHSKNKNFFLKKSI